MIKVLNFTGSSSGSRVRQFGHVSSIFRLVSFVSAPVRRIATSRPHARRPSFDVNTWKKARVRAIRINTLQKLMTPEEIASALEPLRLQVREQGDLVRKLKEELASDIEVKKAVTELLARKKVLEEKEIALLPNDNSFEKARVEDLLKRRFFIAPSFEIYGGYAGQFDLGPMGCKIKYNILEAWRNHFVIEEDLIEVDCTCVTPEPILKASGHVERFADLMVKDLKTGECFRLDHLIKAFFEDQIKSHKTGVHPNKDEFDDIVTKLDGYSKEEMGALLTKYNIKSPLTKNDLSEPLEFNLMFDTMIGPTGKIKAYLRPELAQGIFVNFRRALEFNHGKLPFGSSQIGQAFRNEIAPRSGLLRVREFTLAEIEYFVDPDQKNHHNKFVDVQDEQLNLYSACNQMNGEKPVQMRLGDAVEQKLINNQTLGYFIGRIHQFLVKIGIDREKLRFRQHMSNEMAHYASDCWDAELFTSYGWIECVGCADRSCYDLTQHTNATSSKLVAQRRLAEPKQVLVVQCIPNKPAIGKLYKKDGQALVAYLSGLAEEQIEELERIIAADGKQAITLEDKQFEIVKEHFTVKKAEKMVHVEDVVPNVIEPSFGIGRIMYCLFEHTFKQREDKLRTFFSLPPQIAPIKCSILPLISNELYEPFVKRVKRELTALNISTKVDERESIGKRYSRTDELSIPFAITIDTETPKDNTVTVRERDTTYQVRVGLDELPQIILNLSAGKLAWSDLVEERGLINQPKQGE